MKKELVSNKISEMESDTRPHYLKNPSSNVAKAMSITPSHDHCGPFPTIPGFRLARATISR